MIFVTVGTHECPFDRLISGLVGLQGSGEEIVVQCGPSRVRHEGVHCEPFMPFEQMVNSIRQARVVIAHAGVGSVLTSLAQGKVPFVIPRRAEFGEAVDDHQVTFATHAAREGLVVHLEPVELAEAMTERPIQRSLALAHPLIAELRDFLLRSGSEMNIGTRAGNV